MSSGTLQRLFSVHPRKEPVQASHSFFFLVAVVVVVLKPCSAKFLENEFMRLLLAYFCLSLWTCTKHLR